MKNKQDILKLHPMIGRLTPMQWDEIHKAMDAYLNEYKALLIMDKETIDLLDNKITDIRIQLGKTLDREILDKMLYDLQIDIFKLEK